MKKNKNAGFSLIEIMVAVAIVAILALIAYPQYVSQLTQGRRAAAQSFLLEASNAQQQFMLDNRAYSTSISALNLAVSEDVSKFYTVTVENVNNAVSPPTFSLRASPKAGTSQAADGDLVLNHLGQRSGNW